MHLGLITTHPVMEGCVSAVTAGFGIADNAFSRTQWRSTSEFMSVWRSALWTDPIEGHLFVVSWTSTPSWRRPGAFQTLVVFLFWRRPYRRPPQGGELDQYPSMGRLSQPPFVAMGVPRSSWWRDERTCTDSLWIKARDAVSPHEQA
ncbi:hypothetical protein XU18_5231 [Perkinsela sp. CCAP 1560/4]|nr:hypothetical protein XU18_5231 [Perkinsela sp. CCAP 1560/4]|eukprot:KNH00554.1 hypothetical protein XU18_5231 [Perkinsela sp. CCAP 1560/4]